ncbi:MAG TPA: phage/plasmid primase, P4 family [Rhizomicrobium sp.]|jgi:putative DNA primase/helicase
MSDHGDPFDEEDLTPVAAPKGSKRKAERGAFAPGDADEGDDVDRVLSYAPLNDFGNAKRLQTRFGEDLMHVEKVGWFTWDGARWDVESGEAHAIKRGHQVSQQIIAEAKALQAKPGKVSPERIDRLYAWSVQTGNTSRVSAMLAASKPYLAERVEALDADTYLLAAPNGTIELSTHCELRESRRADRITRVLGVKYNTAAQCPRFEAFLEQIMPDEEMRAFLQRILGYCLTGSMREQVFFIFYGTGSNGKSTLMNIIRFIMASYAMNSPIATFLAKREGSGGAEASPDLARLPGARMVSAAEPPEGARLDEAKVKDMSGGETMTVRHLNQGFFDFRPVFKAVISTNHKPVIRGTDRGIWRRIRLVPFTVSIPDDKIDRNLEAKLLEEAEGILQWMLDGCEEWFATGLRPPEAAIAAVEAYRADEDPVGEFLKARCEVSAHAINPSTARPFETSAKRLREVYTEWCKDEGLDPLTGRTFGTKLTGRGIERRKTGGNTVYVGVHVVGDPT